MGRKIPREGTKRYPGLRKYLEMEPAKRREKGYNISKYNKAARDLATWAINFLTLFCERQEPSELPKVLTLEPIKKLTQAMLSGSNRRSIDPRGSPDIFFMEMELAAMFMENGASRCMGAVAEPYYEMVDQETKRIMSVLKGAAVGVDPMIAQKRREAFAHPKRPGP